MIETARLILSPWREEDRDDLAAMVADPQTMVDYPAPQDRRESDVRFERYSRTFERVGYTRWCLRLRVTGEFVGYCGIQPLEAEHPIGEGPEIGWRLRRVHWGKGLASEAARASLADGFGRCGMTHVFSYTTTQNLRSQAVMQRIGLDRVATRDFDHPNGDRYVVWMARRPL
ncbi:MAG: GNAT family N-acetyltransferase [Proteobacteria bacterium]|nr:GNAT family N-acetyltransferase [Pseudomonadota bacterium]